MNARARFPSDLRYLARFSSTFGGRTGAGAGDARGDCFAVFFGELKKWNLDFVGGGVNSLGGGAGCRTGCELALIWAIMCGSRLTLKLSVNSSLLCSILVPFVSRLMNPTALHVQFKLLLDLGVGGKLEFWGSHIMDTIIESATHGSRLRG